MNQNILKTNVITNETVYCETLEQGIDTDYLLPDYCEDILKILKCKAVPRISLKSVSNKTITIDGSVYITVFYSDRNGRVNSFCQSYPFEKIKETDIELENGIVDVTAKSEYINCRAVNGRKVDIHGAIALNVCVSKRTPTEIISDIDDKDIEILRGSVPATSPTGYAEKYLIVEEDIDLPGEKQGERVFGYDITAKVNECKIINDKILVKGEMNLKIKYLSDNTIENFNTEIPFSQVLEIETAGSECTCSAKACVAFAEVTPKNNSSGTFNSCFVNAKLLVCANTVCDNDVAIILDAYSRKSGAEIEKDTVCFYKIARHINETFNCKKSIEIESGDVASVLDNWCDVKISESGFSDNYLNISGIVTACFITEDSNGLASYFEKTIEFSYKYPFENDSKNLKCEPNIFVSGCNYTILSANSIEIRVDLLVDSHIVECEKITVVTGITESNEVIKKDSDGAMIIYFADVGERIWDIAKKYLSSQSEIKEINGLNEDQFSSDTAILIPIS